mgnify:CR=1 FL=1
MMWSNNCSDTFEGEQFPLYTSELFETRVRLSKDVEQKLLRPLGGETKVTFSLGTSELFAKPQVKSPEATLLRSLWTSFSPRGPCNICSTSLLKRSLFSKRSLVLSGKVTLFHLPSDLNSRITFSMVSRLMTLKVIIRIITKIVHLRSRREFGIMISNT